MYFLLIVSLLFTVSAFAQTLCTPIGNSIYCVGPHREPITITPPQSPLQTTTALPTQPGWYWWQCESQSREIMV